MSWLSEAIHGVGHALEQALPYIGAAAAVAIPVAGIAGLVSSSTAIAGTAAATGANSLLGSVTSDISSGVSGLTNLNFGSVLSGVDSIATSLGSTINSIANDLDKFLSPITNVVKDVANIANTINTRLIAPIANTVSVFTTQYKTLIDELHTDLRGGLQGLLKIPQDVNAAIQGTSEQINVALNQLQNKQHSLATDVYVPALGNFVGNPLTAIHEAITKPSGNLHLNALYNPKDELQQIGVSKQSTDAVNAFVQHIQNDDSWWAPLFHYLWEAIQALPGIIASAGIQAEEGGQAALASFTPTLLDPATAVRAWRLGLISDLDATNELERRGYGPTRIKVLYDAAQYLFSAQQTVDLFQRQIIDKQTFDGLMAQNNLDTGQAAALVALSQEVLGAADITAALARGIIPSDVADTLYQAANVPLNLTEAIRELALQLIPPSLLVKLSGLQAAANGGFLTGSLKTKAPETVTGQAGKAQMEPGLADLLWLEHWRLPELTWWIRARQRELIDDKTFEGALTALNIPREVQVLLLPNQEKLIPDWLISNIVQSGVIAPQDAAPILQRQGYSAASAQAIVEYGVAAGKSSKSTTAADLAKVSLGNAATMFNAGIIDGDTYSEVLLDHGYSADAATLTVELAQQEAAITARKNESDALLSQVLAGQIGQVAATSQLYNSGYTGDEVAVWTSQLDKKLAAVAKLPTEAQLDKMLTAGLITQQEWLEAMQLHGYSAVWADRLLKLVQ